jgi:hypothetical protein
MDAGWIEPLLATLAGFLAVAVPALVYARVAGFVARVPPEEIPALRRRAYCAARNVIDAMLERGECNVPELAEFDRATAQAERVFDRAVANYLHELRERAFEALRMRAVIVNPGPVAFRPEAKVRWAELMRWFALQPSQLDTRLAPFLARSA